MTNASVRNSLFVLPMLAVALALSLGAFAVTVYAQEDYTFADTGYNSGGYYDGGYTYADTGYSPYSYDTGYTYADTGYSPYSYDAGYTYADTGYDPTQYCNCDTPSYSYDTYDTYDTYAYDSYSPGYSSGYGYSMPISYSTPTFYAPSSGHPVTYSAPVQQQQQQTASVTPINIVNTNTNANVNTNTVTVAQVTPQPVVQYVYPQTYSYPVYTPTYYYPNYYSGYNYNYQTYTQAPYCTITATNGANGLVTLYWSSSYATGAYINPSVGNVAPNGSTSLYPYGNTYYTMTVSGQGGTNTCRTQVYAPTTNVSLSQIPYTGFDFGPVGNAIYWMSLLAFAAAGAYLAFYFKGGAVALVGSMLPSRKEERAPVVIADSAPVEPVKSPIQVDVFAHLPTSVVSSTKDAMKMSVTEEGTPRIVIVRG